MQVTIDASALATPLLSILAAVAGGFIIAKGKQYLTKLRTAVLLTAASAVALTGTTGMRVHKANEFDNQVGSYLQAAYETDDPTAADKYLSTAIAYLDENKMTNGFTSVLYKSPSDDVGEWYEKLGVVAKEIHNAPVKPEGLNTDEATKNGAHPTDPGKSRWAALMRKLGIVKVRPASKGEEPAYVEVKSPDGISIYPNVTTVLGSWLASLLGFMASLGNLIRRMAIDLA